MLLSLRKTLIVTRREVRDQFRDWRIIFPILILTIFFPALMNFTARQAVQFVGRFGAEIVAERLIPFLLMVVGFFPISISLVIALESFVGEKERRSIEPLLCSPLSDAQLYVGKLLAAMVPTLLASYLGIAVYLIGIYQRIGWKPQTELLIQMILLTTIQAIVMVSGAVVVSSQTTSVRAANLLASFIIIPMALLIQGEAMVMFWAKYSVLWWAILGQMIIAILLIRTGVAYFNREELLGRELDELNFRWGWRTFKRYFTGRAHSAKEWLLMEIPQALRELVIPEIVCSIIFGIGVYVGIQQSTIFKLPEGFLSPERLREGFAQSLMSFNFSSASGATFVWLHNLRVIAIASLLGIFTFGVLGILVLILPLTLISYLAASFAATGNSPLTFLIALVLPHGLLEVPTMILAGSAILSLGATLAAPAQGKTIGEAWLSSLARFTKIMLGLVFPLFFIAALVEAFITPRIALTILGP